MCLDEKSKYKDLSHSSWGALTCTSKVFQEKNKTMFLQDYKIVIIKILRKLTTNDLTGSDWITYQYISAFLWLYRCFGGSNHSCQRENEEIPYMNDDNDSLSESESKSNESDIEASMSETEYPCVTLVLPNSRISPMDKLRNKTPLQFSNTNNTENSDDLSSMNMVQIDSVDSSHSINGETQW